LAFLLYAAAPVAVAELRPTLGEREQDAAAEDAVGDSESCNRGSESSAFGPSPGANEEDSPAAEYVDARFASGRAGTLRLL